LQARPTPGAAALLEGLPSGRGGLDDLPQLKLQRNAPGCACCGGNLVFRVTLNRLLQAGPSRLYIGVAPGTHLDPLATMLAAPPYSERLEVKERISL
jgi:hypothetical protein